MNNFSLTCSCFLWCCISAAPAAFGQQKISKPEHLVINGVTIVDVERGTLNENMDIIVVGESIAEITPTPAANLPDHATVVDGHGAFVIPGLFDAHVHYVDPATFGRLMIANGVLFVREMGNPTNEAINVRDKLAAKEILGPEMITTGSVLDGAPPAIPQIAVPCATAEEGREGVRRQVAAGVDQIKVYSGLEKQVFLAIADEAHRRGIKIVGHVPESVYIEDAANAGMASAEHLFGFGKIIARQLGEQVALSTKGMGTDVPYFLRLNEIPKDNFQNALSRVRSTCMHVCPTLVVFKHGAHMKAILADKYPGLEYASPMLRGMWRAVWGQQPENDLLTKILTPMEHVTKEISRSGIPLMVGTDLLSPGVVAGFSVHEEMALWQEAGIAPADILRSATLIPARFMGVGDRLGLLAQGRTASFVLLRSNPLLDIRNASEIEGVVFRGQFFSRDNLDQILKEVRSLCHQ
jgi:imidazolonepropionase-like amidohydrolase